MPTRLPRRRATSGSAACFAACTALALTLTFIQCPATAADLLRVYLDARQEDPVYASAREAWAAAQEKLPQARALLLPNATLSANPSYTDRDIAFRNGTSTPGRFNSNGVTVSVTQPLFRLQNLAQYRSAQTQLTQADMTLAAAAQDLVLRVAQAYFDVLLAQDNLDLARAQKTAIAEQLAVARRNFQLGSAAVTDMHEAQARFDLSASLEISAQTDLENRREVLQQITAKAPATLAPLGSGLALQPPEPNDITVWVEQGSTTSQQIAIQKAAVEIAEQEVARARYGHYPTVDAVASYSESALGQGAQGAVGSDTRSKVIGLQFSMPIFAGGGISSQARQAQSNLAKARQDLEAATRQVSVAVRQAFRGVTNGITQIRALEAALQSSQSSLASSRLGRDVGIRTQVDVLDAQQQLFSARFNLAQARYNYVLSWLKLRAAAGQLTEADVRRVNEWLGGPDSRPAAATTDAPIAVMAGQAEAIRAFAQRQRVAPAASAGPDEPADRAVISSDARAIRTAVQLRFDAPEKIARPSRARKTLAPAGDAGPGDGGLGLSMSSTLSPTRSPR